MEEGWQVATGGRRRDNARHTAAGLSNCPGAPYVAAVARNKPPTEAQIVRACAALDAAAAELAAAAVWAHVSRQLSDLPPHCAPAAIRHMVVYGLGSLEQPGAIHIRCQLAAAKLLAALLPLAAAAEAFDPVFTALDHAALGHCGIKVLTENEHGRRVAHHPTLFFMPHCEAALTDALLAANLAAGTLENVVILGNRFSGYQHSWPLRHGAQQQRRHPAAGGARKDGDGGGGGGSGAGSERPVTMLRLCECRVVQEVQISECGFPVASAFNDMGLHWFPVGWQQRLEASASAGSGAS